MFLPSNCIVPGWPRWGMIPKGQKLRDVETGVITLTLLVSDIAAGDRFKVTVNGKKLNGTEVQGKEAGRQDEQGVSGQGGEQVG